MELAEEDITAVLWPDTGARVVAVLGRGIEKALEQFLVFGKLLCPGALIRLSSTILPPVAVEGFVRAAVDPCLNFRALRCLRCTVLELGRI